MSNLIDLTGRVFGRLTVKKRAPDRGVHPRWLCACICGKESDVSGVALRTGGTRSCGCLKKDTAGAHSKTHGMSTARIFKLWSGMMQRCYYKRHIGYANYGGRGIKVCTRWHKFENFLADMGEGGKGLSIERRRNGKGYSPSNCYWATRKEQSLNKRTNRYVTFAGITQCIRAWADEAGIQDDTIRQRLNKGWPTAAAILLPVQLRRKQ